MPDQVTGDEDDDIRERFAAIQRAAEGGGDAEEEGPRRPAVPEPPAVRFERPRTRGAEPEDAGFGRGDGGGGQPKGLLTQAARRSQNIAGLGVASTIGISLVVSIAVGTGFGWLIDRYLLHTRPDQLPLGLIVGFLLGVLSGFINLVRVANRLNRDE
jgi:F0F1-type ATP synthase assembly protein I